MRAKLPSSIYSSDQLGTLAWELEEIINELQKRSIRRFVAGVANKKELPIETSRLLVDLLQESGIPELQKKELEDLLMDVRKIRESTSSVTIILAAEADNTIRRQFTQWLRQEIHPDVLCSFSTRTDLCGGAIVRTSARQYDFSFRSKIINNKQRIAEIFNGVR